MAAELSTATTLKPYNILKTSISSPKTTSTLFFTPLTSFRHKTLLKTQRRSRTTPFTVCVLMEDPKHTTQINTQEKTELSNNKPNPQLRQLSVSQKMARKKSQRSTYLVAAVMSSFGVTSMAILAVYYRFSWQMEGLGITVFGIAYMFVHDGLVHKRFPVGPIANVPYFTRVAAAHQLHHSDKFKGVPYGLFLGPKEVEEVGGLEELEKEISRRTRSYTGS